MRIENKIEDQLSYRQYSFQKIRGTRKTILSLRMLIEKQLKVNNNTFIGFVDQTLQKIVIDFRD